MPYIVANRSSTGSFPWLNWSVQKPLTVVTMDLGVARVGGGWFGRPRPQSGGGNEYFN